MTSTPDPKELAAHFSADTCEALLAEACDRLGYEKPLRQRLRDLLPHVLPCFLHDRRNAPQHSRTLGLSFVATFAEVARTVAGRAGIQIGPKPVNLDDVIAEQERLIAVVQRRREEVRK